MGSAGDPSMRDTVGMARSVGDGKARTIRSRMSSAPTLAAVTAWPMTGWKWPRATAFSRSVVRMSTSTCSPPMKRSMRSSSSDSVTTPSMSAPRSDSMSSRCRSSAGVTTADPVLQSQSCSSSRSMKPTTTPSSPCRGRNSGRTPPPPVKTRWQTASVSSKSARSLSRFVTTIARGMPTNSHSSQRRAVAASTPSAEDTTNRAASAPRRPARSSPMKSAYPGVSIRLTTVSCHAKEAIDRPMERFCRIATGSLSPTVVPSTMVPRRVVAPAAFTRDSRSEVLPEPAGPTSATFRIRSGDDALGAAPGFLSVRFSAMCWTPSSVCRKPLPCSASEATRPRHARTDGRRGR